MREIEDLEPLPNGVGSSNIPLDAIVGMSRSTRAVPNSLLSQITFEAGGAGVPAGAAGRHGAPGYAAGERRAAGSRGAERATRRSTCRARAGCPRVRPDVNGNAPGGLTSVAKPGYGGFLPPDPGGVPRADRRGCPAGAAQRRGGPRVRGPVGAPEKANSNGNGRH